MEDQQSTLRRAIGLARESLELAGMMTRLARDLPRFLRRPLSLDEARARVVQRLEHREARFLQVVERTVYRHGRSPYRRLLEAAGCQFGDLRKLVYAEGLEGALGRLAELGVYVTYDELKGRRDAVRGSQRFRFTDRDFDNPLMPTHFVNSTGGTRGRPSRVRQSLALVEEIATIAAVTLDCHGIVRPRHVFWIANPTHWMLVFAKLGQPTIGWFCPLAPLMGRVQAWSRLLSLLGSVGGQRLPVAIDRDLTQPEPMAKWLAWQVRGGSPVVVTAPVSAAARVAVAAAEGGFSLEGVVFLAMSEPLSAARRGLIESSGASVFGRYATVEAATIGFSCAAPTAPDDTHFFADRWGLVKRARPVALDGPWVNALALTSLTPTPAKIFLNAELGDSADVTVRDRRCCALGGLGLTTHLSNIRSFEKLTGEGTTFARSNLLHILEEILPARFGGSSLDYQLVEQEGGDSLTRLVLRVDPSVGAIDETLLRSTLLEELGRGSFASGYHAETLRRAESVAISREPPLLTSAGKILPFHLSQSLVDRAAALEQGSIWADT